MIELTRIAELPKQPAVYALYGGTGRGRHVAYVGIGGSLRGRIKQHLVKRDSSISTGTSAACLNPEFVTEVEWWQHPDFENDYNLTAAEIVAFDILNPALRSRGNVASKAKEALEDDAFKQRMSLFFEGAATGRLVMPTLAMAMDRIAELEEIVANLRR